MNKVIHAGYTVHDDVKTFYIVDDKDALPADIREYHEHEMTNYSWLALYDGVRGGEAEGNFYVIQIGDMYYETRDDV